MWLSDAQCPQNAKPRQKKNQQFLRVWKFALLLEYWTRVTIFVWVRVCAPSAGVHVAEILVAYRAVNRSNNF